MTIAEIALCLADDLEQVDPPEGAVPGIRTVAESFEFAAWLRSLTPLERLQWERDGRLSDSGSG